TGRQHDECERFHAAVVPPAHAAAPARMAPELNQLASMDPRVVELQKEAAGRDDVIGLAGGLPADELLPRAQLSAALASVTASREDALQYGRPEGAEQLRRWIANRLAARGARV